MSSSARKPSHARCALLRLSLLALMLGACGAHDPSPAAHTPGLTTEGWAWVPIHPRTHEPAVAALILGQGMRLLGEQESEDHPLGVGLWADGTLISSFAGSGKYGHPYRTANIGAEACERICAGLRTIMLGREGKRVSYGVSDADYEVVLVRSGDRVWRMDSRIDLFEADPNVIAFPGGVGARDQRPPVDPNDPEEQALLEFREAWARAKQSLLTAPSGAGRDLDLQTLQFAAIGSKPR